MKALILAAGFGTRLLPFTKELPKPLFQINGSPILHLIIQNLINSGCEGIVINTHHLGSRIKSFIDSREYPVPVTTRHEPEILGTGGAIKNCVDLLGGDPFLVINSDILTNLALDKAYEFHMSHEFPATLVLIDCDEFNTVTLTSGGFINNFGDDIKDTHESGLKKLTFTGVQVLDPEIVSHIPENIFFSSIDLYKFMIKKGMGIKAFIPKNCLWRDIGNKKSFMEANYGAIAPLAFKKAFGSDFHGDISKIKLKGDGSDREWFRLRAGDSADMVMVNHGISIDDRVTEADSFFSIGNHLFNKGLPLPKIFHFDRFTGMVFLQDLGDEHLDHAVQTKSRDETIPIYERVIKILIKLSTQGIIGFDPLQCFQSPDYNEKMILEMECRYFVDAFLNRFLDLGIEFDSLYHDFHHLSRKAMENALIGFMHRDFQSRNIMVNKDRLYLIDFQGSRRGPIQYDLASLLIDPYVALPFEIQESLAAWCAEKLAEQDIITDQKAFLENYFHCLLARNLQILGAFGYLGMAKGKTKFLRYIPQALETLKYYLNKFPKGKFNRLKPVVNSLDLGYIRRLVIKNLKTAATNQSLEQ